MPKPQWQMDIDQRLKEIQGLLTATTAYAGREPSHGLLDLYMRIENTAKEVCELYRQNFKPT